jgi:hypothetical protein
MREAGVRDVRLAAGVGLAMFLVFSANGREIGTYDSQPTKFAARELLLRGTLSLNHVVGTFPQLLERPGFRLALDSRYRSAYSPVPSIAAAAVMWPFWKSGVVDVRAPLAANLMSAVSGAFYVALALALVFLAARLELSRARSLALVAALGLGTGWWSTASQTVWQHETTIFGLVLAVLCACLIDNRLSTSAEGRARIAWLCALGGLGLGIAGGSRLQLIPAIAVLLFGTFVRAGARGGAAAAIGCASILLPVCVANTRWFGDPLGAAPMLEDLHEAVHATSGTFSLSSGGFTGLLFSPNRGLLIFSPVLAVAALGIPRLLGARLRSPLVVCTIAAWAQYTLYASYVVWWGGHTYGPRYMLDVLPLLLPLGIAGAAAMRGRIQPTVAAVAFAWSVAVAAIGAFNHPEGRWNNDPYDVDRYHDRLWEWDDLQIARAWHAGPSPQNFALFTRAAVRVPSSEKP